MEETNVAAQLSESALSLGVPMPMQEVSLTELMLLFSQLPQELPSLVSKNRIAEYLEELNDNLGKLSEDIGRSSLPHRLEEIFKYSGYIASALTLLVNSGELLGLHPSWSVALKSMLLVASTYCSKLGATGSVKGWVKCLTTSLQILRLGLLKVQTALSSEVLSDPHGRETEMKRKLEATKSQKEKRKDKLKKEGVEKEQEKDKQKEI